METPSQAFCREFTAYVIIGWTCAFVWGGLAWGMSTDETISTIKFESLSGMLGVCLSVGSLIGLTADTMAAFGTNMLRPIENQ